MAGRAQLGGSGLTPFEVWASPEPTFARISAHETRDQLAETGHEARDGDMDLLASLGVSAARYPVLWEKCAPQRGEVFLDAVLAEARHFSGQEHFFDDVCLVSIEIERLGAAS